MKERRGDKEGGNGIGRGTHQHSSSRTRPDAWPARRFSLLGRRAVAVAEGGMISTGKTHFKRLAIHPFYSNWSKVSKCAGKREGEK